MHALDDIRERLAEMPDSIEARAACERLKEFTFEVRAWAMAPPTQTERAALVREVLAFHIQVLGLGRRDTPR